MASLGQAKQKKEKNLKFLDGNQVFFFGTENSFQIFWWILGLVVISFEHVVEFSTFTWLHTYNSEALVNKN